MKYIIEIPDDVQYVLLNGKADNKYYTAVRPVAELEILNSDYINEHYGELQDEAYKQGYAEAERIWRAPSSENEFYQKGFEDGKRSTEKGCEGCKYESVKEGEPPCYACSNTYKNRYTPVPHSDRIEVGDEVEWDGDKCIVTYININIDTSEVKDYDLMMYDGSVIDHVKECRFTKTGKHYDIQSILEAMRK